MNQQNLKLIVDEKFKLFDKNGDGFLQLDEFIEVINDIYSKMGYERKISRKEGLEIMGSVDQNGDRKISKMELLVALKKFQPNT
jgi:Ca2+-binding EF-hand superfamily protein